MALPIQYRGGFRDGQNEARLRPPKVLRLLIERRFTYEQDTDISGDGRLDDLDLDRSVPTRIERYELRAHPENDDALMYFCVGSMRLW